MTRREAALAVYTRCVGAVVLARAVAAPEARQRILATAEKTLLRALGIADEPALDRRVAPWGDERSEFGGLDDPRARRSAIAGSA